MTLEAGTRLLGYEIDRLLGAGGMGEVYLARDERRGARVALKVLKAELTNSREHMRRFEREARAISSLKHPNTLAFYEIVKAGATHFIVMEWVEGGTLRELVSRDGLAPPALLDIAAQAVSALAAAHAAGIIHRDIKPENVMVRRDGRVKVLDFGLAKLAEEFVSQSRLSGESTISNVATDSGVILGTVSYMSPEQLRGQAVDERTDIWSVGAVLYELAAGRAPFTGASPADVIVSILEREPPPLTLQAPNCPAQLQHVIMKALTKRREGRYQTAAELLADLRLVTAEVGAVAAVSPANGREATAPAESLLSSASGALLRPPRVAALGALCALAALAAAAVAAAVVGWGGALLFGLLVGVSGGVYLFTVSAVRRARVRRAKAARFQNVSLTRLTNTGTAVDAAISPDGRYVAYVREEGGLQSLWVRQLETGGNVRIVPAAAASYQGITFSNDSETIHYVMFAHANRRLYSLYTVPARGGEPRRLIEDVDTPVTFAPDGRRLAFVRGYPSQREVSLIVAASDGSAERRVASRRSPDIFGWRGGPDWSPDGRLIACSVGVYDASMRLVGISPEDGSEVALSERRWSWVGRLAWLRDGSGLLVNARDAASGFSQLWHVSHPEGEVRRVTNDLSDYGARSVSLTSDARALVTVQADYLSGIWVMPRRQPALARQITGGRSDGYYGLSWAPDGRIVYASKASGNQDIWIMGPDGEGQTQLTSDAGSNYHPSVTPDGRHIIFISTRTGVPDIWRMRIDGGDQRRLSNGSIPGWPQCTPDGQWVIYKAMGFGTRSLCKIPIEGGVPLHISNRYTGCISVSQDGRRIACEYWDGQPTSQLRLAVMPLEGEGDVTVFPSVSTVAASNYLLSVIHWSPDAEAVTYIDNRGGFSNIWSQPVAGGEAEQVTDFRGERIFWFDWSRDGEWLACARGVVTSDVVLIRSDS
ncbi:MAG: protein kinase [Acidobacteria bacterium]|nr:protein kinase [Acidobacteriota bacterium]